MAVIIKHAILPLPSPTFAKADFQLLTHSRAAAVTWLGIPAPVHNHLFDVFQLKLPSSA